MVMAATARPMGKARKRMTFTPEQVREALVYVRRVAGDISEQYATVTRLKREDAPEKETSEAMDRLFVLVSELEDAGLVLKGYEHCLIAFPARQQGQRAVILWRLDDPDSLTWRYECDHASERPIETFTE